MKKLPPLHLKDDSSNYFSSVLESTWNLFTKSTYGNDDDKDIGCVGEQKMYSFPFCIALYIYIYKLFSNYSLIYYIDHYLVYF